MPEKFICPQWHTQAEVGQIHAAAPAMQAEAEAARTYPGLAAEPEAG